MMADSFTSELALVKPEPRGSVSTWGYKWNENMARLDEIISEVSAVVGGFRATGVVKAFAQNTAPAGWLECAGQSLTIADNADLFEQIGIAFGQVDDLHFSLPDFRGKFIMGLGGSFHIGDFVSGQLGLHNHSGSSSAAGSHNHGGSATSAGYHDHSTSVQSEGNHDHSGSTNTTGNHNHTYAYRYDSAQGNWSTERTYTSLGGPSYTEYAGNHNHSVTVSADGAHSHSVSLGDSGNHTHTLDFGVGGSHSHTLSLSSVGGAENRPANVALLICIKT